MVPYVLLCLVAHTMVGHIQNLLSFMNLALITIKNIVPLYNLVFCFFHRNNDILKEKGEKHNQIIKLIKVIILIYSNTTVTTQETLKNGKKK